MGTKVYDNYEDLITFNRNSKGTALRPIGYGDELVTNGTFDTDTAGWSGDNASLSISSSQLVVTPTTINVTAYQELTLEVGKVYVVSADLIDVNGSTQDKRLKVGTTITGGQMVQKIVASTPQTITAFFVATATVGYVNVYTFDGTNATVWDNISVKEVFFDREGDPLTLFLHPEGVPRIEYDADRNLKGLLIEPDGQNICLQSGDFGTTWTPSAKATPAQSTEETPDGDTTNKYIRLVDDESDPEGTGTVRIIQSISVSGGTQYTASVFLKKDGLNWARLQAQDTSGTDDDPFQYFDLDNGVTGTGSAGIQDATIKSYPNDWYRCSITWTQGAGDGSFNFRIQVANADNDTSLDLDGSSSIFVWGAQVEEGPIATSYMPTTGSPFTRGKDEASMTNVSGLIGQKEGTLYVEVDWRVASGTSQYLLSVNDGTSTDRIFIYNASGFLRMRAVVDNDIKTNQGESSTGYSGIQKIAFAYADGDFELYRNGSSISSDVDPADSLAALDTLTDIELGQTYNAAVQANMHIRAVQIIPRRLSDAQLIELTS